MRDNNEGIFGLNDADTVQSKVTTDILKLKKVLSLIILLKKSKH